MARTFNYKDWYERNKAQINADRRAKYRQNPLYREQKKREFKDHYYRSRENVLPVDRRVVRSGSGRLFVTIGRVARLVGREATSIRRYHKMGVIPEPRFYDSRGWRLYTPSQVELMRAVFSRLDNPLDNSVGSLDDVQVLLERGWMEMTPIEEEVSGSQETDRGRRSRTSVGGRSR